MAKTAGLTLPDLKVLAEQGKWSELIHATGHMSDVEKLDSSRWFFRGLSFLKSNQHKSALEAVKEGIQINPQSEWGNQLLFEAEIANDLLDQAFSRYKGFLQSRPELEPARAWYVQKAAELDLFDLGVEMNETRAVICTPSPLKRYALALQCYAKSDTLEAVFKSLLRLRLSQQFNLIMIIDRHEDQSKPLHSVGNSEVRQLVGQYIDSLSRSFSSVEVIQNPINLGTAPTCRRLLDYVAEKHDGFIFIEDDCILDASALEWSIYHLENTIAANKHWFFSCESIFFDKQGRPISDILRSSLIDMAANPLIMNSYHLLSFVPSTCFGTTTEVWRRCAKVRSFTRGPESLSRFLQLRGMQTVCSVVPRASDIGMQHELGYSVNTVGRERVREIKDTFLLAENFNKEMCRKIPFGADLIYSATSQLNPNALKALNAQIADFEVSTVN